MNYRLTQTLLVVLLHFVLTAQNNKLTIRGYIRNSEDSSVISLANISIKDQAIGTFSNEVGEFVFHIPDTLANHDLIISSIGYYNLTVKINNAKSSQIFYLKPHDYNLKEIIIFPDSLEPKYIIKKAIRKISKNYANRKSYIEAFYRGQAYNSTGYLRLTEAAVGIFDFGYDAKVDRSRIKVLEMRKSIDYTTYSQYKKVFKLLFEDQNILYEMYERNPIRTNNNNAPSFRNNDFMKKLSAKLVDITYIDNQIVYVVSFRLTRYGGKDGFDGQLFINAEDFAFVKIIFGWFTDLPKNHKLKEALYNGRYWYQTIIRYKKYKDKYYPNYIEYNNSVSIGDYAELGVKYKNILVVNNIYTNKSDYEKIKKANAEKKDIVLYQKEFVYNKEFWDNYNILLTNPLSFKAFQDLEKEKSLETQFQENSK
jgi:hypothetical protein